MRDTKDGDIARLAARAGAKSLGINLPGVMGKVKGGRKRKREAVGREPIPAGVELLCLDVSSTATGWALLTAMIDGQVPFLHHFGVIRPPGRPHAIHRIDFMVDEVSRLVVRLNPDRALMEFSEGLTHGRLVKARGLSILGAAQGAVRQELRYFHVPTETITERDWTGGRSKSYRAMRVRLIYPHYARAAKAGADPGMDIADSIGLALWRLGVELLR